MKSRSQTFFDILLYAVLALYAAALVFMLFLKTVPAWELLSANRQLLRSVNIAPLHSVMRYASGADSLGIFNVLGNVLLFVPMGVYLMIFRRDKRIWTGALWAVLISVFAEIAQYVLAVGVSDIDDVILNGLGGLLGVMIHKALLLALKNERRARNLAALIAAAVAAWIGLYCLYLLHIGVHIRITDY